MPDPLGKEVEEEEEDPPGGEEDTEVPLAEDVREAAAMDEDVPGTLEYSLE